MELLQQIKDFLIPELESIRQEQSAIRDRLNTIDLHLVDQSRRIDVLSQRIDETNKRIDEANKRIDETNKRIDKVHDDLLARIDETNKRLDETNMQIDKVRSDLIARIGKVQTDTIGRFDKIQADFIARIDETHRRLDRLYEVIVRRDEHENLESWVREWAREVNRRLEALERRAA